MEKSTKRYIGFTMNNETGTDPAGTEFEIEIPEEISNDHFVLYLKDYTKFMIEHYDLIGLFRDERFAIMPDSRVTE